LYCAAGRGIAAVSSAIEESDLYLEYRANRTDSETMANVSKYCYNGPEADELDSKNVAKAAAADDT